ncbi:cytochrome C biogenesis protein CcmH [Marinomonas sp. 42_23_T18]|nr:cytochrome C biogenesis protein CcmH [Marinomonas sp. 42_23_T18]
MSVIRFISIALLAFISVSLSAETEKVLNFRSDVDQIRYNDLISELRCPKCQNQNLADSNAQIAIDLRTHVYDMINEGTSDTEILAYMVARYGEFVLYRPQKNGANFILWYGPFILLGIGLLGFILVIRSNAKRRNKRAQG